MTLRLPEPFLRVPLAHRALHDVTDGRPENSRAAVKAALAAGYGIEIDVQLSADVQAMVFHDHSLERLAEAAGPVREREADALSQIPLRGGDEGIPKLPEILTLVAGKVPLLIEIKDQDGALGSNIGPLEYAVAAALAQYSGPVAVMSYNPHSTTRMATLAPNVPRGLVSETFDPDEWGLSQSESDRLSRIPDYDSSTASFISHDCRDLHNPRVAELKNSGADILCWTVRSPEQEAEARKIAQNITFEGYLAPFTA